MKKGKELIGIRIILSCLCLLLFIEIGFFAYIFLNPEKNIGRFTGFAISEERIVDNLRFAQSECIRELGNAGINLFGENENSVSIYVSQNIKECFSPAIEKYIKKCAISSNLESINIAFSENSNRITAKFPILINNQLFDNILEVKL